MTMRILLFGESGQVGYELRRQLCSFGEVLTRSRASADLARPDQLRELIRCARPAWIVNAAAYTAVDKAESDPEQARAVNASALGVIGAEAAALGCPVVHFSTDYVFDGTAHTPYLENAPTGPINVYGRTKLEGERLLAASGAAHFVLRTSWVYGTRGHNFLLTILRRASEGHPLRIVCDQIGAPTWSRMLATATGRLIAQLRGCRESDLQELSGIYHLSAAGQTSWADFAQAIVEEAPSSHFAKASRLEQVSTTRITPIPSSEYPTPAQRPAYSVLCNEKIGSRFGIYLPDWREQLHLALN